MRISRNILLVLLCSASFLAFGSAYANTTNIVPFNDSFEVYTNNQSIVGTNGWAAAFSNYAFATNKPFSYTVVTRPLRNVTTNNYIVINTEGSELTNQLSQATNRVWIDSLVQLTPWPDTTPPEVSDNTIQMMLYLNTNKHIVIYHATSEDMMTLTNIYTELPGATIDSNQWIRLSINTVYDTDGTYGFAYFCVHVDGSDPLISPYGYATNDGSDYSATNGPWHIMATTYAGNNMGGFSSYAFKGVGLMDELVVSNEAVLFSIKWRVTPMVNNIRGATMVPNAWFYLNDGASTNVIIDLSNFWYVASVLTNGVSVGAITNISIGPAFNDVVVTSTVYAITVASNTPQWWLAKYIGPVNTNDADALANSDTDYLKNWEEWIASTDPQVSNTFEISSHYVRGGTAYVEWVSSCVDPALPAFKVYAATNGLTNGYSYITNVTRPLTAQSTTPVTNVWYDETLAPSTRYYKVTAPGP